MGLLSPKTRGGLKKSQFAGPDRSYPVNDRDHAEAAILDSKYAANPAAIKSKAEAALRRMK
jgi:hypothetical protein